jgi:hypothetical protein
MFALQNKTHEEMNKLHEQAREYRAFAAILESDPNAEKAAKMWHRIADSLFDAVDLFDKA